MYIYNIISNITERLGQLASHVGIMKFGKKIKGQFCWAAAAAMALKSETDFKFSISEMKTHVFDCGGAKDAAKYDDARKELASHCQQTFEHGGNAIAKSVRDLKKPDIDMPELPEDVDAKKKFKTMNAIEEL